MNATTNKMDMWAVVPVKCLSNSKTRLASVLGRAQRVEFTLAMLHDVLEQLSRVKNLAGICILSDDMHLVKLAGSLGVRIWSDNASDLNHGLQAVSKGLEKEGYGVMIIPCDVPVARTQDYQRLLDGHREGVTLVEASADGGTNALLCDAGQEMLFNYGAGSFVAHKREAEQHGIPLTITRIPRLQRDIDRPGDLDWLVNSNHDCRARDYLLQLFPEARQLEWKQTA